VWLYPSGEPTRVSVGRPKYLVGAPIDVHWSNAPGMGLDWVSVFRCATTKCAPNSDYLVYSYTGSRIEGQVPIGPASIEGNETWPLPPGRHVARLLPDDGLRSVAQSKVFEVVVPSRPQ
jgi:hypothetical protein